MKNLLYSRIAGWLLKAIELQLFITLVSLPILIGWGLPISPLAIIGNLIFTPFLAAILFLSSLIVICELFYIPNFFFIHLLEWVTMVWQAALHTTNSSWFIAYKKLPDLMLILLFILTFFLIAITARTSVLRRIGLCSALLLLFSFGNKSLRSAESCVDYIPCNNRQMPLIVTPTTTALIDPGILGARINAASFVEYQLVPTFLQKTGRTVLDHLILTKPGTCLFKAVTQLLSQITVKNIYMPDMQGRMSIAQWKEYAALKKRAEEQQCTIHQVKESQLCELGNNDYLSLTPTGAWQKSGLSRYYTMHIMGQIDNSEFTFYSPLKWGCNNNA